MGSTTIRDALRELLRLPGAQYSCAADATTGEVLAEAGGGEFAAPGSALEWGGGAARFLGGSGADDLDDLMVTSRRAYHLVRHVPGQPPVLVYLCLDRARGNLAAARRELATLHPADLAPATPPLPDSSPAQMATHAPPTAPVEAPSGSDSWPAGEAEPASRSRLTPPRAVPRPHPVPHPRRAEELPQRAAGRTPLPPRPEPPAGVSALGRAWATDTNTMSRLLEALRDL